MGYNLFLDDCRKPSFLDTVLAWETVRSYGQFVHIINERGLPDLISFDHDLAEEHYAIGGESNFSQFDYSKVKEKTGFHCAQWLVDFCLDKRLPLPRWQVHSMNPCGKVNIEKLLEGFEKFQQKEGV